MVFKVPELVKNTWMLWLFIGVAVVIVGKVSGFVALPAWAEKTDARITKTEVVVREATEAVRDLAIIQAKDWEKQEVRDKAQDTNIELLSAILVKQNND